MYGVRDSFSFSFFSKYSFSMCVNTVFSSLFHWRWEFLLAHWFWVECACTTVVAIKMNIQFICPLVSICFEWILHGFFCYWNLLSSPIPARIVRFIFPMEWHSFAYDHRPFQFNSYFIYFLFSILKIKFKRFYKSRMFSAQRTLRTKWHRITVWDAIWLSSFLKI